MYNVNKSLMERALNKTKSETTFLSVVTCLIVFMFVIVVLNTFVFINVLVSGPSMQPTMFTDDVLIANRFKTPTYGSIVIISGEKENGDWIIKRVIAMEGDTVDIRSDGYVYVKYKGTNNFVKLEETYVNTPGDTDKFDWRVQTIADNEIFYLGDNRANSSDSRLNKYSTCNKSQIVGVVEDWSFALKGLSKTLKSIFNKR